LVFTASPQAGSIKEKDQRRVSSESG